MSHVIVNISDDSFETEVLRADGPVLVDYWAEWCGPCKIIAPVLQEIAEEFKGKLKVAKLNIDENPQTPPKYGIRGIPTLLLFKHGNVEATKVGGVRHREGSGSDDHMNAGLRSLSELRRNPATELAEMAAALEVEGGGRLRK